MSFLTMNHLAESTSQLSQSFKVFLKLNILICSLIIPNACVFDVHKHLHTHVHKT